MSRDITVTLPACPRCPSITCDTFATLAIRGLDPTTVQVLMGHSKITTTERYLHARPLTELAERMDAIFGSSLDEAVGPDQAAIRRP
jgi:hypothetical protein